MVEPKGYKVDSPKVLLLDDSEYAKFDMENYRDMMKDEAEDFFTYERKHRRKGQRRAHNPW